MKIHRRCLLPIAIAATGFFALTAQVVKAAPFASCVTNNNGTIQFYLNESGGSVLVTYEDGTSNSIFDGMSSTAINLPSGQYGFNLAGHSSYSIAVTKFGTGPGLMTNVIQSTNVSVYSTNFVLQGFGDPRGLAINTKPSSPYFGRIYVTRGGTTPVYPNTAYFFDMNADGSWVTGPTGSVAGVFTWVTNESHANSPDRISIAANDDLVVGDWSSANAGVWLVGPDLTTNELLLGPIGEGNGVSAGVHGEEIGRPVLLGDPATNAVLLTVDAEYPSSQPNSILSYSNITQSVLSSGSGWTTGPSKVGPCPTVPGLAETTGSGFYFYPSLVVGPSGYVYSGEFRSAPSTANPAAVQVFDPTLSTMLWQSRYTNNGTETDYFYTSTAGGSACLPTDIAVSPDGKYLVAAGVDNHFTVCVLTNGIPDVSTLFTIKPDRYVAQPGSGFGNEVAWDAADNIYMLGFNNFGLKAFTLGQSATYTTSGNATGATNFSSIALTPTIGVYATNNPVISQNNSYGHPTSGYFTIVRNGPAGALLTVNFTYSGTASNGTYTAGSTGSVVLQPGQTVTNILITAVTDGTPRLTTALTLTITASMNYNVSPPSATMSILNTATPLLIGSVNASSMYNAFSNDYASMTITRLGDTNTTETVNNFTVAGTAAEGTDYTIPTPVTFNPGDLTKTTFISPLVGGQVPVHNPKLPYTGNKSVILGVGTGTGYNPATNTATITIVDSAYPAAPVLFSDALTNSADVTNWVLTAANGNLDNNPTPDVDVEFGCNLYNTPSYPVPTPPNGATNALRMTVNKSDGTGDVQDNPMAVVNAYFTNAIFSGNYAVRFNMNIIQGDSTSLEQIIPNYGTYDAEEGPLLGINHNGTETNWWVGDAFTLGDTQTTFGSDGVWYWICDNGGAYFNTGPYKEFTGLGGSLPNTGWTNLATQASSTFATAFKTNVFTCYASTAVPPYDSGWTEGGPGLPANGTPTLGFSAKSWSDVEIKQMNNVVSLYIDKTRIFAYTNNYSINTGVSTNGLIMLGYEDPYNGGETSDTAVYFSNLQVVQLTAPQITTPTFNGGNNTFVFNFTSTDGDLTPASFAVQGSTNLVTGAGFKDLTATITQLSSSGSEVFQASVPASGSINFYRVRLK